jgi:hypothetical protein
MAAYLVIASPDLGLARVSVTLASDRYAHAASMAWVVLACAGLCRIAQRRWPRGAMVAAGAGTIAELIRCATPAILVPFPQAADNHQWANARFFEQQGGGIVLDQRYLSELEREVSDVMFNDWLLRKFRANLQRMDHANSLDLILGDLEELARTAGRPAPDRPAPAGRSPLPAA